MKALLSGSRAGQMVRKSSGVAEINQQANLLGAEADQMLIAVTRNLHRKPTLILFNREALRGAFGRALVFQRLTSSRQTTGQAELPYQEAVPPGENCTA